MQLKANPRATGISAEIFRRKPRGWLSVAIKPSFGASCCLRISSSQVFQMQIHIEYFFLSPILICQTHTLSLFSCCSSPITAGAPDASTLYFYPVDAYFVGPSGQNTQFKLTSGGCDLTTRNYPDLGNLTKQASFFHLHLFVFYHLSQ